jgi:hypothetical protein
MPRRQTGMERRDGWIKVLRTVCWTTSVPSQASTGELLHLSSESPIHLELIRKGKTSAKLAALVVGPASGGRTCLKAL